MIYIETRDFSTDGRGPWTLLPESPHAIGYEELVEARRQWQAELEADSGILGARLAPQTTARGILEAVSPGLQGFDRLALGFAVTATACRVSDAVGGPWERLP